MAIADHFVPQITSGVVGALPKRVQVLDDDGAITIADGVIYLTKGTASAITIDTPPADMNGAELAIISITAAAHTVTHTPGFGGGTTSRDLATFGGAISDGMVLRALDGVWYVQSTRNVTLS